MSRKFDHIEHIENYEKIRQMMKEDLDYRLESRQEKTSFGRPLYYHINVQVIMTQECPFHCPFCLERKHPMKGQFEGDKQIESLKKVLAEHPGARLTITGGEPSLYPEHVKRLVDTFKENSDNTFCSINTSGYNTAINEMAHINLSVNDYVNPDPVKWPYCTVQTVLTDDKMNIKYLKRFMDITPAEAFSFRHLSTLEKKDYNVEIFNEIANDPEFKINTFRVGDFFTYATFDYNGKHGRITLGDMYQQTHNDYKDGYSNIIIHPNGRIGLNWR